MAFDSYANLQTAVAGWLNRNDLTTEIPDFIELCEARLRRDPAGASVTSTSLTLDSTPVSLPDDFREAVSLYHDSATVRGPIELVPFERLATYKGTWGATGIPVKGAILFDALELHLAPAPDASYTATLVYDQGVDSTFLLTHFPDVYLYGTLVAAEGFLKNDPRMPTWKALFDEALESLRQYRERAKWGAGPLVIRPRVALGE